MKPNYISSPVAMATDGTGTLHVVCNDGQHWVWDPTVVQLDGEQGDWMLRESVPFSLRERKEQEDAKAQMQHDFEVWRESRASAPSA
jgi:hypothetical protein